jgi:hypothetical protein
MGDGERGMEPEEDPDPSASTRRGVFSHSLFPIPHSPLFC